MFKHTRKHLLFSSKIVADFALHDSLTIQHKVLNSSDCSEHIICHLWQTAIVHTNCLNCGNALSKRGRVEPLVGCMVETFSYLLSETSSGSLKQLAAILSSVLSFSQNKIVISFNKPRKCYSVTRNPVPFICCQCS